MAFPQSFLDELAARNDILDVVGSYVSLQPKGGSYWGCCPFHNEKTPSFHVLPDRQYYHCFGCKKGGGVISFIMEIENLSYPDAVRFLAKRANIPVPEDRESDGTDRLRRRLLDLNRDAARYYYDTPAKAGGRGGAGLSGPPADPPGCGHPVRYGCRTGRLGLPAAGYDRQGIHQAGAFEGRSHR